MPAASAWAARPFAPFPAMHAHRCVLPQLPAHSCKPFTSPAQAMNRSLANVILGGYGSGPKGPAAKIEGTHTEIDVPGAAEALSQGGWVVGMGGGGGGGAPPPAGPWAERAAAAGAAAAAAEPVVIIWQQQRCGGSSIDQQ